MNAWEQIKQHLETKIGVEAFQNWILRTAFLGQEKGRLRVSVPDNITKEWLEQDYAPHIRTAIDNLALPVEAVAYELASTQQSTNIGKSGVPEDHGFTPDSQLNPKFSLRAS